MPAVIHATNPYNPSEHQIIEHHGDINSLFESLNLHAYPTLVMLNDQPLMREYWHYQPTDDDVVLFVRLPAGGNSGGSNPLKVIAMIALAFYTMGQGGAWIATTFNVGANSFAAHAIAATLFMAGATLINAVLPDPTPELPNNSDLTEASPTYSANNRGNSARIGRAIPVVYGTFKMYPDFACQPFSKYQNNKQYLYQVFCIGQGSYDVSSLYFGGTNVDRFNGIDVQYFNPGQTVNAFDTNIISNREIAGQKVFDLSKDKEQEVASLPPSPNQDYYYGNYTNIHGCYVDLPGNNITFKVSITHTKTNIYGQGGFPDSGQTITTTVYNTYYYFDSEISAYLSLEEVVPLISSGMPGDNGGTDYHNYTIRVAVSAQNTGIHNAIIYHFENERRDIVIDGPINIEISDKTNIRSTIPHITDKLLIDITAPRGLNYTNDRGDTSDMTADLRVYYRKSGETAPSLLTPSLLNYKDYKLTKDSTGDTTLTSITPLRWTLEIDTEPDVYDVWLARLDAEQEGRRYGHELRWSAHRARAVGKELTNKDCTYVAVKSLVTEQLSEVSSLRANFIVKSKIDKLDDNNNWVPGGGSNPVWIIADMIRNNTYGAGLSDYRLNLDELKSVAAECDAENLEFNGVIDNNMSFSKALGIVSRVAFATTIWQGGRLRIVRDKPQEFASSIYTMDNIIKGSLSTDLVLPSDVSKNAVTIDYVDSNDWNTHYINEDSGITPLNTQNIKLIGCTNEQQATKYAKYTINANKYQRQFITFDTGMDGFIPSYNELIKVSHELLNWTKSGIIEQYINGVITSNIPIPDDEDLYIVIRDHNTQPIEHIRVTKLTDYTMQLSTPIDLAFDNNNLTRFSLGTLEQISKKVQVLSIIPRANERITITGVVYDERVYDGVVSS